MLRSLKILFLIHLFFLPLTCLAGSPGPTRQELLQRRDSIMRSRLSNLDAQDVTIHLALCYKESFPILTISYKNNTDKDIYFLSYYTSVQNYPGFRLESALTTFRDARGFLRDSLIFAYENPDNQTIERVRNSYCDERFLITFSPAGFISSNQCLLNVRNIKTLSSEIETEGDFYSGINYDLNAVYDYIRANNGTVWDKHSIGSSGWGYKKTSITVNDILENKQYFIFLAKNGQISEEIDLSGFKILRGSYFFSISPGNVPDSIVTDFKKGFPVYTKLPEKINGYYLYSGPIRHNSIEVIF